MGLLYTKMKIFHFKDKIDSLLPENEKILSPLHIRLKPTNICNHNCWYCAYRREHIQLGKDMEGKDHIPWLKMQEVLDDIVSMEVKAVTFSGGGEPLCYPKFNESVLHLVKGGVKVGCLTNASLLNGKTKEILSQNATWVRVSIDGWDSESYASYRSVSKEEYHKVMDNLRSFVKEKHSCLLGVVIIVDKYNHSHIYDLIKELRDIGVDSVKVAPCLISNDSGECKDYHSQFYNKVLEQTNRAEEEFSSNNFEIFSAYKLQLTTFEKEYNWCPYIQINPVIGADLNVYSCHDKAYNFENGKLFSIKNQSFRKGWFSDKQMFFKINPKANCKHHCMVDEKNKLLLEYLNADPKHLCFV